MIIIEKDITVFGVNYPYSKEQGLPTSLVKIYKGSEITTPIDLTNTGAGILIVTVRDNNNQSLSMPLPSVNTRNIVSFLDEMCRMNTGDNSFAEYNDAMNHKAYN